MLQVILYSSKNDIQYLQRQIFYNCLVHEKLAAVSSKRLWRFGSMASLFVSLIKNWSSQFPLVDTGQTAPLNPWLSWEKLSRVLQRKLSSVFLVGCPTAERTPKAGKHGKHTHTHIYFCSSTFLGDLH